MAVPNPYKRQWSATGNPVKPKTTKINTTKALGSLATNNPEMRYFQPYLKPKTSSSPVVSNNVPKTNAEAWNRYGLDPEEVYWQTGSALYDKKVSSGLTMPNINETFNWQDIHLKPENRPSWYPGSTTGAPWTAPGGAGSGGSGGSGGGGGGYYNGGGGGGGGESAPAEVTWSEFDYKPDGAPAWWKALKPSEANPATEYLAAMNLLIPTLSPEDQRSVAANLYQQDPVNFAHLNPEKLDAGGVPFAPPNMLDTGMRQQFTSAGRSGNALQALSQLAQAMGKSDAELGPGYRYLRSILNVGQQFGSQGNNMQTRRQQLNAMGALDPLLSQSQTEALGAYGPLARMLSQPYFSAGQLVPMQKTQDGRYIFGEANKELF